MNKQEKIKSLIRQMQRHETLNKSDMAFICDVLNQFTNDLKPFIILQNVYTKELSKPLTIDEVLAEINRDRSDAWQSYNENDWHDGLDFTEFTHYDTVYKYETK